METETALRVLLPLLLGATYLGAELRHNRHARLAVRLRALRETRVVEERRAAGAEVMRVRVVGESGKLVRVGTSREDPTSISGTPTLRTEPFAVRTDDGREFSVPGGERLRIHALPGARRNVMETVTTDRGVEQQYSFELSPELAFELFAIPPPRRRDARPFRSSASAEPLTAYDGAYVGGESIGALLHPSAVTSPPAVRFSWWIIPTSVALAILPLVAAGASAFWLRFSIWLISTGCILVAVWATGLALVFTESPEASTDELEQLKRAG